MTSACLASQFHTELGPAQPQLVFVQYCFSIIPVRDLYNGDSCWLTPYYYRVSKTLAFEQWQIFDFCTLPLKFVLVFVTLHLSLNISCISSILALFVSLGRKYLLIFTCYVWYVSLLSEHFLTFLIFQMNVWLHLYLQGYFILSRLSFIFNFSKSSRTVETQSVFILFLSWTSKNLWIMDWESSFSM